ncbi:MAG: serine/threonine protein kinase [Pseudomonadota bacterium]
MDTPYAQLTPDLILSAIESLDLLPTGGLLALNSYENRVYQVAMEDGSFLIAKFYRPQRWTDAAIDEEHRFSDELAAAEISVVAPLKIEGKSLFEFDDYRFALFPRQGGHPPNLENEDDMEVLARTIARLHVCGQAQEFVHREALTVERLGWQCRSFLLDSDFVPLDIADAYRTTTEHLLESIEHTFAEVNPGTRRIHGDCHMGNVLWRDDTPHFVDFDDCLSGPPIQDLWMLLSGERAEQTYQLSVLLDAYQEFADFEVASLALIEPLRTLRIMHHAAWIGRRWQDPAFPMAFPDFDSARYWSNHLLALREQQARLTEPPLQYL